MFESPYQLQNKSLFCFGKRDFYFGFRLHDVGFTPRGFNILGRNEFALRKLGFAKFYGGPLPGLYSKCTEKRR